MADKKVAVEYTRQFKAQYLPELNKAHLQIILQRQTQFVGTRTLALSFKFLAMSMKFKITRQLINEQLNTILVNISLPLFITSQKDLETFSCDPVEYVRLQADHRNEYSVKRQLSIMVETIC